MSVRLSSCLVNKRESKDDVEILLTVKRHITPYKLPKPTKPTGKYAALDCTPGVYNSSDGSTERRVGQYRGMAWKQGSADVMKDRHPVQLP